MESPASSIREFAAVIRHYRVTVLVCLLLIGGTVTALTLRAEPQYRAEAALSCRPPTQTVELLGLISPRDQTQEERAAVCAERANRHSLVVAAKRNLKLRDNADDLDERIDARAETRTNLVVITVEDPSARRAARIANAVADGMAVRERRAAQQGFDSLITTARREYRRALGRANDAFTRFRRRDLREQLAKIEAARDFTRPVEISERASVPASSFSPKTGRNIGLGVAGGLLVGILVAFLRSSLDRRLRGAREIENEAGLPMIGSVRESALGKANFGDPEGHGDAEQDLESFRILQTNLAFMNVDRPLRRILVTSPLPEEGKSTVAASLAVVAGLAGQRILLVEADLRRPVLAGWFGIDPKPGLTEFLAGQTEPREAVRAVALAPQRSGNGALGDSNDASELISVIVAGGPPPRPAELLRSQRFADLVSTAARAHDLVILDAPPLLPVTDALDLVPHVDAVILCVRAGQTTRDQLRAAVEALRRLPERPTGYVVTGVSHKTEGDYGYHGYAYGSAGR